MWPPSQAQAKYSCCLLGSALGRSIVFFSVYLEAHFTDYNSSLGMVLEDYDVTRWVLDNLYSGMSSHVAVNKFSVKYL